MSTASRSSALGPILIAALILIGLGGAPSSAAEDPRAFIDRLGNEAVDILDGSDPVAERQAALEDLLRRAFDFDTISRLVLGRFWHTATPEQQQAYQEAFATFVVQTYARRLADKRIDDFAITDVRTLSDRDTLVETVIEQPGEAPTRFGWRVRRDGERLKLVDVVVDGVSMVISRRSEFTSVVQREGMDGLIQSLRASIT